MKKFKGVLVKKVKPNYEMADEEAEFITKQIKKGFIIIYDRTQKEDKKFEKDGV